MPGYKSGRANQKQNVPLTDKEGNAFNYTSAPPIPRHLHEIDLRLGGQIKMPEEVTNPDTKDEYYISSLIEEAITSSQLEGATTRRGKSPRKCCELAEHLTTAASE